jgi:hypothetical protein
MKFWVHIRNVGRFAALLLCVTSCAGSEFSMADSVETDAAHGDGDASSDAFHDTTWDTPDTILDKRDAASDSVVEDVAVAEAADDVDAEPPLDAEDAADTQPDQDVLADALDAALDVSDADEVDAATDTENDAASDSVVEDVAVAEAADDVDAEPPLDATFDVSEADVSIDAVSDGTVDPVDAEDACTCHIDDITICSPTVCGSVGTATCGTDCTWNTCLPPLSEQICNDSVDDDCNGLTDCEDTACTDDAACPQDAGMDVSDASVEADVSVDAMDEDADPPVDAGTEDVTDALHEDVAVEDAAAEESAPIEICNGLDDDGVNGPDDTFACVKDSTGNPCTLACGMGTYTCSDACMPGICVGASEVCDGVDNDADCVADNGFACVQNSTGNPCQLACGEWSTYVCTSDCTVGTCAVPSEICNDSRDNDCNGKSDCQDSACALSLLCPVKNMTFDIYGETGSVPSGGVGWLDRIQPAGASVSCTPTTASDPQNNITRSIFRCAVTVDTSITFLFEGRVVVGATTYYTSIYNGPGSCIRALRAFSYVGSAPWANWDSGATNSVFPYHMGQVNDQNGHAGAGACYVRQNAVTQ